MTSEQHGTRRKWRLRLCTSQTSEAAPGITATSPSAPSIAAPGISTVSMFVALLSTLLIAVLIPWHMDEFIAYHALACWQPEQQMNAFRESCAAYPTQLGPWEFQRSYSYVGIASSLVMAPFHALWSAPWVTYVVGALFLAATALGVIKSLDLAPRLVPIVIVFFPLAFTVLHDGGPVRLSLLALAWTPFIAAKYLLGSLSTRVWWGSGLVLMWMTATEDKPFFLYLTPGIGVFVLAAFFIRDLTGIARASWKALALLIGSAAAASLGLLLLLGVEGAPYLQHLVNASPSPGVLGRFRSVVSGVLLTIDWPFYAQRVVDYPLLGFGDPISPGLAGKFAREATSPIPGFATPSATIGSMLTLVSVAGVIALYVSVSKRQFSLGPSRKRASLLLLGSALALWIGAAVSGGWASHHFVFAQIPLVGLLVYAVARSGEDERRLFAALAAISGVTLASVILAPTAPTASREIARVFEAAVNEAGPDSVINCSSWGCYYTYSFTNVQGIPVVFADDVTRAGNLQTLAHDRDLEIFHICMGCNQDSVEALYASSRVTRIEVGTSTWHVYRVVPNSIRDPLRVL